MRPVCAVAVLALLAFAPELRAGGGTIGLVPDPDPVRHRELVRGAELALAGPGSPRLAVGRPAGPWDGLTAVIEELVAVEGAEVLVAPADRRAAHLVAQVATRRHLPAVATAVGEGLAATGSWWLVTCERDGGKAAELAGLLGRPPSEWEQAGWAAARVAARLLDAPHESWVSPGSAWRDRLPEPCRAGDPQPAIHRAPTEGIRNDDHDR